MPQPRELHTKLATHHTEPPPCRGLSLTCAIFVFFSLLFFEFVPIYFEIKKTLQLWQCPLAVERARLVADFAAHTKMALCVLCGLEVEKRRLQAHLARACPERLASCQHG